MKFGELPRTCHSIAPVIVAAGIAAAGSLASAAMNRHGGGSSGSTTRTPAPRTIEGENIWGEYMKRLQSGEIGRSSRALQEQLGGLAESLGRPAFAVNIGGQTVPVVPRRNIALLGALSENAGQQFAANQYETNLLHDLALALERMRYGIPGESGTLTTSPGLLDTLGKGMALGKAVYDMWPQNAPQQETAASPYAGHYNGQPLIGPGGRVVAI